MIRFLVVILLLAFSASCVNDELCVDTGTNDIKLRFFEYGSDPESSLSIAFDSIGISGEPPEYPALVDTTLSSLTLSVDPDSTWTQFVFIASDRTDTLEVGYRVTPSLISVDCGPELLFSGLDTLYHTFDSLIIVQDIFNREVETNIKIYY